MDVLVSREAGCRERPNRTLLMQAIPGLPPPGAQSASHFAPGEMVLLLLFQLSLPLLKLTLFRHCPVAPPSGALRATQIAPGNLVHALSEFPA